MAALTDHPAYRDESADSRATAEILQPATARPAATDLQTLDGHILATLASVLRNSVPAGRMELGAGRGRSRVIIAPLQAGYLHDISSRSNHQARNRIESSFVFSLSKRIGES